MWTATSTKFPLCWSSLLSRHVGWILGGGVTGEKRAYFSLPLVCCFWPTNLRAIYFSPQSSPASEIQEGGQTFRKILLQAISFRQNCARMLETQTKTSGWRAEGGLMKTKSVTNTGFQSVTTASKSNDPTTTTTNLRRQVVLYHDKLSRRASLQFNGLGTIRAAIKWSIPPQFSNFFLS